MVQKAAVFVISSSLLISLFYYNYHDNVVNRVDDLVTKVWNNKQIYLYNGGSEPFLINTSGCAIPNYGNKMKFEESKNYKQSCGQRAIFVQRFEKDQIIFQINASKMKKYTEKVKNYKCCYMFGSRSKTAGKEDTVLSYTSYCKPFKSGFKTAHLQEVVTVKCVSPSKKISKVLYEDAYLILKKRTANKVPNDNKKQNWNVLLLGMDTMSRARIFSTMPKTVKYLQKHDWLDYKGYQKVGYNTFPNVMSILTGMNVSSVYSACRPDMFACNDLMLWSTFSKAGYTTAYGEDNLRLPDTFFRYNGFRSMPTHHYMRQLFITGEQQKGNVICTKHLPSGKHILDYAYDFADNYKNDSFFGIFWINSYSHNLSNLPTLFENDVIDFFEKANNAGIMDNTFIVFISDHGIRFGPTRVSVESYYEERLPMFFVWVPNEFRKRHEEDYYNLQLNQNRLVTPYDLYLTLTKISNMSVSSADIASAACPLCQNLFEEIPAHRTCTDAGVSDKWCSCHGMKSVNTLDKDIIHSLQLAIVYVQNKTKEIKTNDYKECHSLKLEFVLRTHSYLDGNRTYYVVAFQMTPGQVSYEAIVLKENNELSIVGGVDTLSGYNLRGNCVKESADRMYCVCKDAV